MSYNKLHNRIKVALAIFSTMTSFFAFGSLFLILYVIFAPAPIVAGHERALLLAMIVLIILIEVLVVSTFMKFIVRKSFKAQLITLLILMAVSLWIIGQFIWSYYTSCLVGT